MFNLFKKKCPACKMELKDGVSYPADENGTKFCSESCRETYGKKMDEEQSKKSGECCH